jgi:pre-mRNA-processing factor 19
MTKTLDLAAQFNLEAPVQAMSFSENGFWLAATARNESTVVVFDLRKDGAAAIAKRLEIGGPATYLAWDYTGQFLAVAGTTGVAVHQYDKSSKSWSECFKKSVPAIAVRWGEEGRQLLSINRDGVVTVFGTADSE